MRTRSDTAEAAAESTSGLDLVEDGLVDVGEAARFLDLSRTTLYAMMEAGQLAFVKLGRSRRIPRRALRELAAKALQGGQAQ